MPFRAPSTEHRAPILLEIACGSLRDVHSAARAKVDRIELCSAMELGGLTPSPGVAIETSRLTKIPFVAMIRPRGGDFVYAKDELDAMELDALLMLEAGAEGIVFGCLTRDNAVDTAACARLVAVASGQTTVFHRAFDQIGDQGSALDSLIGLGVTRVLTSGGQNTALEGAKRIRALVEKAAGRIEILPGGGIREENVEAVVKQTGCQQVHLSLR